MQSLHLVILVFEECLELLWEGVTLRCRLLVIVRSLHLVVLVFEECLELLQGGVTLRCRLLVIVQSLRLVILVFEECLEVHREVLLFIVGCWLLCDHYIWSNWFSKNVLVELLLFLLFEVMLAVYAICTASCYGFFGCKLKC